MITLRRLRASFAVAFAMSVGVATAAALLGAGDRFPAWSLVDERGQVVASKDLLGRTYLLWFYPKAGTPGCTLEGTRLRDHHEEFRKLGVRVLGVSFDTPAENAAFVKREEFPFRLLSDSDHRLAAEVGGLRNPAQPFASRISYLVGPDGEVLKAYGEVSPAEHAEEVLTDVRALVGQRGNGTLRTP